MADTKPQSNSHNLPGAFSLLMPSWEGVKLNISTFLVLILIPIFINLLGSIINNGRPTATGDALSVAATVVSLIFAPAIVLTQLSSARRKAIDFSTALNGGFKYFWRYVGLAISMTIVIGLGFILFIVPGFFMLRRYILAPYYLIDRDMKVFDAMRASAADSKDFSSAIWVLIGVEILFILLSFVFIGLIFVAMYYCAPAIRYLEIKSISKRAKQSAKV